MSLTHQQARAALLTHISSKCCYGSGAAKQLQITSMDYVPAHHYELQTFTEKRETSWTYAPHKGGEVDGPGRGAAPLPWEMEEPPTNMFKEEVRPQARRCVQVRVVTVPHTGVVKACHKCRGTGGMSCRDCSGKVAAPPPSSPGLDKVPPLPRGRLLVRARERGTGQGQVRPPTRPSRPGPGRARPSPNHDPVMS